MEERQEINAEWWAALLRAEDLDDYPAPELLSLLFDRRLRDEHLGELERQVIEVLATATSALANPKDWLHPFRPAVEFGGRRSSLPSDLDRDQSALLARLAPIIEEPSLVHVSPTSHGSMAIGRTSRSSTWPSTITARPRWLRACGSTQAKTLGSVPSSW